MTKNHRVLMIGGLLLVALAIGVWAFARHVRIVAPELNGVSCSGAVCVDDPAQLPRAQQLHAAAMARVAANLGPLREPPLTVFCSTRGCYQRFGGGMERGATILDLGVILPPESWVAHIVEHEFIHMLQAQELGLWGRQRTPEWFREGMPFLISAPPDHDLPDYAKTLVEEYRIWELRVGRPNVWRAAGSLP